MAAVAVAVDSLDDVDAEAGDEGLACEPDFAVVCSFLQKLGPVCQLEPVPFPDLLDHLQQDEVPKPLRDLYCELLKRAVRSFRPGQCNWEKCLIKFCHQRGFRQDAWELERFGYRKANVRVKLRVLKNLLEYQFVCNVKFKNAINKMENRELRLEPLGRDEKGRIYWLQTDRRANVRLYREDQDEETWRLIASDRVGLVETIRALKAGKSPIESNSETILNEDSNSIRSPCAQTLGSDEIERNNSSPNSSIQNLAIDDDTIQSATEKAEPPFFQERSPKTESSSDKLEIDDSSSKSSSKPLMSAEEEPKFKKIKSKKGKILNKKSKSSCVGEAIEEKVMVVEGKGNGAECEGIPLPFFSEVIEEEVMYVYGEGYGHENMTGNPGAEDTIVNKPNNLDNGEIQSQDAIPTESNDNSTTANSEENEGADSNVITENVTGEDGSSPLAPLPVTKRFLQTIPKSSSEDTPETIGKVKLWSVDSLCSESPSDGVEREAVLSNSEIINCNNNDNVSTISEDATENASDSNCDKIGKTVCEDFASSSGCEKIEKIDEALSNSIELSNCDDKLQSCCTEVGKIDHQLNPGNSLSCDNVDIPPSSSNKINEAYNEANESKSDSINLIEEPQPSLPCNKAEDFQSDLASLSGCNEVSEPQLDLTSMPCDKVDESELGLTSTPCDMAELQSDLMNAPCTKINEPQMNLQSTPTSKAEEPQLDSENIPHNEAEELQKDLQNTSCDEVDNSESDSKSAHCETLNKIQVDLESTPCDNVKDSQSNLESTPCNKIDEPQSDLISMSSVIVEERQSESIPCVQIDQPQPDLKSESHCDKEDKPQSDIINTPCDKIEEPQLATPNEPESDLTDPPCEQVENSVNIPCDEHDKCQSDLTSTPGDNVENIQPDPTNISRGKQNELESELITTPSEKVKDLQSNTTNISCSKRDNPESELTTASSEVVEDLQLKSVSTPCDKLQSDLTTTPCEKIDERQQDISDFNYDKIDEPKADLTNTPHKEDENSQFDSTSIACIKIDEPKADLTNTPHKEDENSQFDSTSIACVKINESNVDLINMPHKEEEKHQYDSTGTACVQINESEAESTNLPHKENEKPQIDSTSIACVKNNELESDLTNISHKKDEGPQLESASTLCDKINESEAESTNTPYKDNEKPQFNLISKACVEINEPEAESTNTPQKEDKKSQFDLTSIACVKINEPETESVDTHHKEGEKSQLDSTSIACVKINEPETESVDTHHKEGEKSQFVSTSMACVKINEPESDLINISLKKDEEPLLESASTLCDKINETQEDKIDISCDKINKAIVPHLESIHNEVNESQKEMSSTLGDKIDKANIPHSETSHDKVSEPQKVLLCEKIDEPHLDSTICKEVNEPQREFVNISTEGVNNLQSNVDKLSSCDKELESPLDLESSSTLNEVSESLFDSTSTPCENVERPQMSLASRNEGNETQLDLDKKDKLQQDESELDLTSKFHDEDDKLHLNESQLNSTNRSDEDKLQFDEPQLELTSKSPDEDNKFQPNEPQSDSISKSRDDLQPDAQHVLSSKSRDEDNKLTNLSDKVNEPESLSPSHDINDKIEVENLSNHENIEKYQLVEKPHAESASFSICDNVDVLKSNSSKPEKIDKLSQPDICEKADKPQSNLIIDDKINEKSVSNELRPDLNSPSNCDIVEKHELEVTSLSSCSKIEEPKLLGNVEKIAKSPTLSEDSSNCKKTVEPPLNLANDIIHISQPELENLSKCEVNVKPGSDSASLSDCEKEPHANLAEALTNTMISEDIASSEVNNSEKTVNETTDSKVLIDLLNKSKQKHDTNESIIINKKLESFKDRLQVTKPCGKHKAISESNDLTVCSVKEIDSNIEIKKPKLENNESDNTALLEKNLVIKIKKMDNSKSKKTEEIEDVGAHNSDDSGISVKKPKIENATSEVKETEIEADVSSKKKDKATTDPVETMRTIRTRRSESLRSTRLSEIVQIAPKQNKRLRSNEKVINVVKEKYPKQEETPNVEEKDVKNDVDEQEKDVNKEAVHQGKRGKGVRKRGWEESQSQSEEVETETVKTKKLKMRQKKTHHLIRKKVEEKKTAEVSSEDENEEPAEKLILKEKRKSTEDNKINDEENIIAEPKQPKKKGRKPKKKTILSEDQEQQQQPQPVEEAPVRQSRRIAQLKIKEEAQRRLMEEMALRELKEQHKKKHGKGKPDQDWQQSGSEHSSDAPKEKKKKRGKKADNWKKKPLGWNSSSGGNETENDTEPGDEDDLYEPEEDILAPKSDHEFSPESEVEGDTSVPIRIARTLKKDDGEELDGGCTHCGKADHPEWILLCDSCDAGWHASCLKPVLFLVPEGEWFCPPCNHKSLISALEDALEEHDKQVEFVKDEDIKKQSEISDPSPEQKSESDSDDESADNSEEEKSSSESNSSESSDDEKIYRLRERRQLPISYRFREYDQLISSAIKEEYKEIDNSGAGNQGRGKDISTIIEADKEEKKALQDAANTDENVSRLRQPPRARRKPRKLNSLEVLSEDCDDNSDEDFKETGWSTSTSEEIVSDGADSSSSHSSDSLPLRRSARPSKPSRVKQDKSNSSNRKKRRRRIIENDTDETPTDDDSFEESLSEIKKAKNSKSKSKRSASKKKKKEKTERDENSEQPKQKAKVKYGGLSDSSKSSHDWSPAHRTRQKKYNYMEMPNTESEEEAHKPSGKHMDSSDEYKGESDSGSESDSSKDNKKRKSKSFDENEKQADCTTTGSDLLKGLLVPIVKLNDISPIKTDGALQTNFTADEGSEAKKNRARRGGKALSTPRKNLRKTSDQSNTSILEDSKGEESVQPDDPNNSGSTLGGGQVLHIPIKCAITPFQLEREKKRKEKEEKLLEKEKRKEERLKKKEEKQMLKEQKAKEREEKKLAKIATMEQRNMNKKIRPDFMQGQQIFTNPIPIVRAPTNFSRPPYPMQAGAPGPMGAVIRGPMGPNVMPPNQPPLNIQPLQLSREGVVSSPENRDQILIHHRPPSDPQIKREYMESGEPGSSYVTTEERKHPSLPLDFRPHSMKPFPMVPRIPHDTSRGISPNLEGHHSPIRPSAPGYQERGVPIHVRPPIEGGNMMPRNGIPIANPMDRHILSAEHLNPENSQSQEAIAKRRGRGPGKKTLARQAAAALGGTPESGSPSPSHSPHIEGTLTVAGAPQPFRPNVDPPSVITRMPHMMPPPYRGSSMFNNNLSMYGSPRLAYRPHHPHSLDPSPSGGGPISVASPERSSPQNPYSPYPPSSFYPPSSTPPQMGAYPPRFPPHLTAPLTRSPTPHSSEDEKPKAEQVPFIKSEIKEEPNSDTKQSSSPTDEMEESTSNHRDDEQSSTSPPPMRPAHPQLKHTESKGGRGRISLTTASRYPQGPYAPQYGPYAPPPPSTQESPYLLHQNHPPPLHVPQIHRPQLYPSHLPQSHLTPIQLPLRPTIAPEISRAGDEAASQGDDEPSEFGGLVSYFSSQQEEDMDT